MSTEYNYKHILLTCPECKGTEILVDPLHQETYCTQCGLVLQDTTIPRLTLEIRRVENEVKFIRNLWRKKR